MQMKLVTTLRDFGHEKVTFCLFFNKHNFKSKSCDFVQNPIRENKHSPFSRDIRQFL